MNVARAMLVRVSGMALIVAFTIHIAANGVVKVPPPIDPSLSEMQTYLAAERGSWALVHGMRYVAVVGLALFYSALVVRIQFVDRPGSGGWEILGLVGGMLHLFTLFIANSIETFLFLGFEFIAKSPELFWSFFYVARVLFNAEILAWAIAILGFSLAGWFSGGLPRWISIVGFVAAPLGLISGVLVATSMLGSSWLVPVDTLAAPFSLFWFLSSGAWLLWRGHK